MKTWANGGIAPPFFTSTPGIDEPSASRPGRFSPDKLTPPRDTLDRKLDGPQCWSGRYGGEKSLTTTEHPNPAVQPAARRDIDS
jgi:hypothetical protein